MAIEFVFLKAGQELAVHVSEKIDFMRVKRGRNYGYLRFCTAEVILVGPDSSRIF
jgi:hypothetical protein